MDHFPENYRDWKNNNAHWMDYVLHSFLINHGVWFSGPGEEWTISVRHTKDDILKFLKVIENFFTLWHSRSVKQLE